MDEANFKVTYLLLRLNQANQSLEVQVVRYLNVMKIYTTFLPNGALIRYFPGQKL